MKSHLQKIAGGILAGAVLSACGGGGGGSSAVTLKTKDDVIREVSNLSSLLSPGSVGAKSAQPGARNLGARRFMELKAGGKASPSKRLKAGTRYDCGTGYYTEEVFSNTSRSLPLFSVSPNMDYDIEIYSSCKDVEGTYSTTQNGTGESGDNWGYAAFTGGSPGYDYLALSNYSYTEKDTNPDYGYTFTFKGQGRGESRDDGAAYLSRDAISLDITSVFEGDTFKVSLDFGKSGSFLETTDNYGSDGTFEVNGPLAYSSSDCPGGSMTLSTPQAISFGSDVDGDYTTGGQLQIVSGGKTVTLDFQSNGDVDFEIEGGVSGVITRAEQDESFDECSLLF